MQSVTHNFTSKIKLHPFKDWLKISCLGVLLVLCFGSSAQNLVPNSGFEYFSSCPCLIENINGMAVVTDNQIINAWPWTGTNMSSDFYHSCATNICPSSAVPLIWPSHQSQFPNAGGGCAGIYMMGPYGWDIREYLQVELTSPLEFSKSYHLVYYIMLQNASGRIVNNFGCYFSQSSFTTPDFQAVDCPDLIAPYNPQIIPFGNPIIRDTINWVKIEGMYKANGSEIFLTLGNFMSDLETDTSSIQTAWDKNDSYYLFDDVSVEEITQPFWQYHDTTIYYGDSVLIGPALTGLDIDWYTDNLDFISNAPGIYVTPPTSRDYIAKETFDGVETEHVVHVTVIGGTGLEENELQNVRVFPNPSKGSFSISGITSDKPLKLEVRDVHGKLVFEEKEFSKELNGFELDVENGIYFVRVVDLESKSSVVEKLVVSR